MKPEVCAPMTVHRPELQQALISQHVLVAHKFSNHRDTHTMGSDGYAATHYEVLDAPPSSTLEEIRACYRAALLSAHPDKQGTKEEAQTARYLRVQEAWRVLRDAGSRARYDASVKTADVVVGEEVALEDMEESGDEGGAEYWYPCRCSDFFVVGAGELRSVGENPSSGNGGQRQSIVLPCGSCSLHLRVYFWVPCS